eukprot:5553089-Alexandrium_andersonii.AAC.1
MKQVKRSLLPMTLVDRKSVDLDFGTHGIYKYGAVDDDRRVRTIRHIDGHEAWERRLTKARSIL